MFLQAASGHEFVDDEPVLVLVAVPDQLDQVMVSQLSQENDFGLRRSISNYYLCAVCESNLNVLLR
jgi:hypothetical protein